MKSEIVIEKILDSTYDGIAAVDQDSKIIFMNKAAKRIYRLKEDLSYVGMDIREVTPNARMPEVIATETPEINHCIKIDDSLSVVTSRMPIWDSGGNVAGAVAIFKELPQLAELSSEVNRLEEVQGMMEAVFSAAQDAISVANQQGVTIMINKTYAALMGIEPSELLGRPCDMDVVEGKSVHREVLECGREVRNFQMRVGRRRLEIIAHGAPIFVHGELAGSVAVAHDLTELRELTKELDKARKVIREIEGKYTFHDIIGESEGLLQAIDKAKRAAMTPATILLTGESGTGKELFAHAIHNESKRAGKPFIRVNCAAISENLLESELFGYEEGAFTGARRTGRQGYFEQADGGTLFLDEIGRTSPRLQEKLLRVLQEKELVKVGAGRPISVDVRIVAATNIDLEEEMRAGRFREDLYYRISAIPIKIPPLRERKEDLRLLAQHMLQRFNQDYGRQIKGISAEAEKALMQNFWRGNVRELSNYIGQAVINMDYDETVLEACHLPRMSQQEEAVREPAESWASTLGGKQLNEAVREVERRMVREAVERCGGNKTKAARELGISIRSLYNKLD